MSKGKGRQRHTDFQNMTPDEISSMARNRALPKDVRGKAQKEEKARGRRNRQKRDRRK